MLRYGFALCGALAVGRPALAQCPDGSPPPCGAARGAPRPVVRAIDPSRIAILPFRVSTADTLLGEGVAELLSQEFAGGRGPQAVHMGTVLRAWRQAGGGPRAPLSPEDAIRAARSMGAGMVVEGSIVGIGQRLTVNAAVTTVPDGRTRRATPVSGSADSLDGLLRRLTTNLLAVAGGEGRTTERSVLTENSSAMRAYIEGLSAWRRYDVPAASESFERAFREDSTFARAAFMRMVVANWGATNRPLWERRTWALRERLSPQDRVLLTAYLGDGFPSLRSPRQILADRERAAAELPESPEAQYVLGDWLFHYGAAASVGDRLERSLRLFQRSLALDSQETVLAHLAQAAAMMHDTALLRELRPALEQGGVALWSVNWLAAGVAGDDAWLERLRRRATRWTPSFALVMLSSEGVSAARTDEALDIVLRLDSSANGRSMVAQLRYLAALLQGRPSAATRVAAALPDIGGGPGLVYAALFADGDTALGREAALRLESLRPGQSGVACALAFWRLEHGQPRVPRDSAAGRIGSPVCEALAELEDARRANAPDLDVRLAAADSVVRWMMGTQTSLGFENIVLARAWESRGNLRRALEAVRLRSHAITVVWTEATGAREEGRLAATVGDTAGAIRAYRRYLRMRREPEPVLIPQRDSVRAALALLERR